MTTDNHRAALGAPPRSSAPSASGLKSRTGEGFNSCSSCGHRCPNMLCLNPRSPQFERVASAPEWCGEYVER